MQTQVTSATGRVETGERPSELQGLCEQLQRRISSTTGVVGVVQVQSENRCTKHLSTLASSGSLELLSASEDIERNVTSRQTERFRSGVFSAPCTSQLAMVVDPPCMVIRAGPVVVSLTLSPAVHHAAEHSNSRGESITPGPERLRLLLVGNGVASLHSPVQHIQCGSSEVVYARWRPTIPQQQHPCSFRISVLLANAASPPVYECLCATCLLVLPAEAAHEVVALFNNMVSECMDVRTIQPPFLNDRHIAMQQHLWSQHFQEFCHDFAAAMSGHLEPDLLHFLQGQGMRHCLGLLTSLHSKTLTLTAGARDCSAVCSTPVVIPPSVPSTEAPFSAHITGIAAPPDPEHPHVLMSPTTPPPLLALRPSSSPPWMSPSHPSPAATLRQPALSLRQRHSASTSARSPAPAVSATALPGPSSSNPLATSSATPRAWFARGQPLGFLPAAIAVLPSTLRGFASSEEERRFLLLRHRTRRPLDYFAALFAAVYILALLYKVVTQQSWPNLMYALFLSGRVVPYLPMAVDEAWFDQRREALLIGGELLSLVVTAAIRAGAPLPGERMEVFWSLRWS